MQNVELMRSLITRFPPVQFSFGYGSAVLKQVDHKASMIDLILVPDAKSMAEWHTENIKMNKNHYSGIGRALGGRGVEFLQNGIRPFAYFNHAVINEAKVKYGVISSDALKQDLTSWNHLYVTGRLHKPICVLTENECLSSLNQQNLVKAVACALLELPSTFTANQLFVAISSLSYRGDSRMWFNENPNKVNNIVKGNERAFLQYYTKALGLFPHVKQTGDDTFEQTVNDETTAELVQLLQPVAALPKTADRKAVVQALHKQLASRVLWASLGGTVKGPLSAGVMASLRYGARKTMIGLRAKLGR
eukprot:TRINITY_DN67521_c1_g6_i2.p1 TRINITY_DN67521_c1_g6~~TRINITY_DN67521_c1_g6_i2.p1  ORF type:complete len:305 (+),score=3.23 TRINITY_DN67521_c1_g6_i2:33-947(+)